MDLKGTVRWSTKHGGGGEDYFYGEGQDYFYGSGVLFTSISDEDKGTIRRFVQEELKKVDPEIPLSD